MKEHQFTVALDLWKITLDAHDRQWAHYAVLALGVLAFLAAFLAASKTPQDIPLLLRRSLFVGITFFMAVSVVSMYQNLLIHNDCTKYLPNHDEFIEFKPLTNVGQISPLLNTAVHLVFDISLLSIIYAALFSRGGLIPISDSEAMSAKPIPPSEEQITGSAVPE